MLETARRLLRYRSLLATFTARELKARYRGSALGFVWSLVTPILLTAVYCFVFGLILVPGRGAGIEAYPLFLIAGLFPWIWVSTSIQDGTTSLIASAGLLRKAAFPIELPPLVSVSTHLVHLVLALPIVGAALFIGRLLGHPVGGWGALALPLVILLQFPMVAGAALGLSALTVLFKDVRDVVGNLLTLIFFLTPIIYPLAAVPWEWLRQGVRLNPFTPFTLAYQDCLYWGTFPGAKLWLAMALVATVFWLLGSALFLRLRETLVEIA